MKQSHLKVLIIIFIALFFSESAMVMGEDSLKSYDELKDVTFTEDAGLGDKTGNAYLTEDAVLSDYLAYAALHNPELEAAFNLWKAALEKIPQVQSLPDPNFTYEYYIENVETHIGMQRHMFNLSQTFPWFGKLSLLGELALQEANIQKQMYENLKLSLFYEVKVSYFDYYYLSRSITVTEDNIKLMSYFENVARTKYSAGSATNADVIKAQVELGKLEESLISLHYMEEPIRAMLNAALNRPSNAILPWPTDLPENNLALSDEDIIRQINENNPGLKALEIMTVKETNEIDLARKDFYPDITFGINLETGMSSIPGNDMSWKNPVMTMLMINLPMWRGKYRAAVQEARARYSSVVKERDNRKNVLVSNMKTAIYNYRDSVRKIELYRDSLIPKAMQALNVTQIAFESGEMGFLDLIDAQRTFLEFELANEKALTDRAKHFATIEQLIGFDL